MSLNTNINGKRILLMGSCGILGKAHTQILNEHNVQLIIADQPKSDVLEYAESLGIYGLEIDVTDEKSVELGIQKAALKYGGLDGAIFNAAITSEGLASIANPFHAFEDYPLELWQKKV